MLLDHAMGWLEVEWLGKRNNRHFQGQSTAAAALGKLIVDEVRALLSSWSKATGCNRLLAREWRIFPIIFCHF